MKDYFIYNTTTGTTTGTDPTTCWSSLCHSLQPFFIFIQIMNFSFVQSNQDRDENESHDEYFFSELIIVEYEAFEQYVTQASSLRLIYILFRRIILLDYRELYFPIRYLLCDYKYLFTFFYN